MFAANCTTWGKKCVGGVRHPSQNGARRPTRFRVCAKLPRFENGVRRRDGYGIVIRPDVATETVRVAPVVPLVTV
jgi:hypothetical protein